MQQKTPPLIKAKPPAGTGGAQTKDRMRFLSLSTFNHTKLSSNLQHPTTDWRAQLERAKTELAWWCTVIEQAKRHLAQERGPQNEQ